MAGSVSPGDTRPMLETLGATLVVGAVVDGALLMWRYLSHHSRQRRIQARLAQTRHLYGIVRVTIADRRALEGAQGVTRGA